MGNKSRLPPTPTHAATHGQLASTGQALLPPPHAHTLMARASSHSKAGHTSYMMSSQSQSSDTTHGHLTGTYNKKHKPDKNTLKSQKTSSSSTGSGESDRSGGTGTLRLYDHVTESEIKFLAGREECTPATCVFVTLAVLFISCSLSSGVYFALESYNGRTLKERVFKGELSVTAGLPYSAAFERAGSREFQEAASTFSALLDRVYNSSAVGPLFRRSEVLALERARSGDDDTVVHFNVHLMNGRNQATASSSSSTHSNLLFVLDPVALGHASSKSGEATVDAGSGSRAEKVETIPSYDVDSDGKTTAADLYLILATELARHVTHIQNRNQNTNRFSGWRREKESANDIFANYTIDRYSLHIVERIPDGLAAWNAAVDPWELPNKFPGLIEGLVSQPAPPPPQCRPLELSWCASHLPYNTTSFPNLVGHWNVTILEAEFLSYKQLTDVECYPRAAEFICRLLQPPCQPLSGSAGGNEVEITWPCREWCEEFTSACAPWIHSSAGPSPNGHSHSHSGSNSLVNDWNRRFTYRNEAGHGQNQVGGSNGQLRIKCASFPAYQDRGIRAFRFNSTIQSSYCPRSIVNKQSNLIPTQGLS